MIIARSPLRISLGGGGTDLPSFYRREGGGLAAAAIDKYVYVAVLRSFKPGIRLRYSRIEDVQHRSEIQHPILREAFDLLDVTENNLEVTTMADIPAGTGLGSSGSFGTALLKALHRFKRHVVGQEELARQACHIEIDRLGEPVGKQDQYAAALGGFNWYEFRPDESVVVTPMDVSEDTLRHFRDRVLLFSTGMSRSAGSILAEQDRRTKGDETKMLEALKKTKAIGLQSKAALESGDLDAFGGLLHEHWLRKKLRSSKMSNPQVDAWYDAALAAGALGGKLIGAGGGGFLMFYTSDPEALRAAMEAQGLDELKYAFDFEGCTLV